MSVSLLETLQFQRQVRRHGHGAEHASRHPFRGLLSTVAGRSSSTPWAADLCFLNLDAHLLPLSSTSSFGRGSPSLLAFSSRRLTHPLVVSSWSSSAEWRSPLRVRLGRKSCAGEDSPEEEGFMPVAGT